MFHPATGVELDPAAVQLISEIRAKYISSMPVEAWAILWHAECYLAGRRWISLTLLQRRKLHD